MSRPSELGTLGRLGVVIAAMSLSACAGPSWGWQTFTSPHFVLHTDSPPRTAESTLAHFEDVHSALSVFFHGAEVPRAEAIVFASDEEYADVVGGGAGAFVRFPQVPEGVLVVKEDADAEWMDEVLAHELAHRFAHAAYPGLPPWLDEGLASYLSTARHATGGLRIGGLPSAVLHFRFGGVMPLDTLARAWTGDLHGPAPESFYASAWAMVHYFLNGNGGRYHRRFRDLLRVVGEGDGDREKSLQRLIDGFKEKTLPEIHDESEAHARRMLITNSETVLVIPAPEPPRPDIAMAAVDRSRLDLLVAGVRRVMWVPTRTWAADKLNRWVRLMCESPEEPPPRVKLIDLSPNAGAALEPTAVVKARLAFRAPRASAGDHLVAAQVVSRRSGASFLSLGKDHYARPAGAEGEVTLTLPLRQLLPEAALPLRLRFVLTRLEGTTNVILAESPLVTYGGRSPGQTVDEPRLAVISVSPEGGAAGIETVIRAELAYTLPASLTGRHAVFAQVTGRDQPQSFALVGDQLRVPVSSATGKVRLRVPVRAALEHASPAPLQLRFALAREEGNTSHILEHTDIFEYDLCGRR